MLMLRGDDMKIKRISTFFLVMCMLLIILPIKVYSGLNGVANQITSSAIVTFNVIMLSFCTVIIGIGVIKKLFSFTNAQSNDVGNKLIINAIILYAIGIIIISNSGIVVLVPTVSTPVSIDVDSADWKSEIVKVVDAFRDALLKVNVMITGSVIGLAGISVCIAVFKKKFSLGNVQTIQSANTLIKRTLIAATLAMGISLIFSAVGNIVSSGTLGDSFTPSSISGTDSYGIMSEASKYFIKLIIPFASLAFMIGIIKKMFQFTGSNTNEVSNSLIMNTLVILAVGILIFATSSITDLIPTITGSDSVSTSSNWVTLFNYIINIFKQIITDLSSKITGLVWGLTGISVAISAYKIKFSNGNIETIQESKLFIKKALIAFAVITGVNLILDFITNIF